MNTEFMRIYDGNIIMVCAELRWIERNSFSTTALISAQPTWLY